MSRNVPTNRVRTLKGCPFCGSRAVYGRRPIDLMVHARCEIGCAQSPDFMTKKAAAEWWNQRAPEPRAEGLLQNMRAMADAFTTMRNDLNELFPIQSPEADLLNGPEFSVSCAAIVNAARAFIHKTP